MDATLTVWEAKERAGLLALETDEWRQKRLIAEDPNTAADVLGSLFPAVTNAWHSAVTQAGLDATKEANRQEAAGFLVAEALVAHPNTPVALLLDLLDLPHPLRVTRAFCSNPVLPFLTLETPGFWQQVSSLTRTGNYYLLAEAAVPVSVIQMLLNLGEDRLTEAARFHVAVAGEVASRSETIAEITTYWKTFCKEQTRDEQKFRQHQSLVEAGLAPSWALGGMAFIQPPPLSPELAYYARSVLLSSLGHISRRYHEKSALLRFVATLQGVYGTEAPYDDDVYSSWTHRLAWALSLPLTTDPLDNDVWDRSPLDLLHHLAHDGNRLVRWAAQTRLADPDFIFTWHEEGNSCSS